MSITGISPYALQSLLDSELTPVSTSGAGQTSPATAVSSSTASTSDANSSSSAASNKVNADLVALLKALSSNDTKAAQADLKKLQKDRKAEQSTSTQTSSNRDLLSLFKDLTTNDTAAAKSDLNQLSLDLKSEEGSSNAAETPLDKLVSKLSTLLTAGSTEPALQAIASYLVENGQGSGSLIDTTA